MKKSQLSGLILAGGKSTRMKSDKAFLNYHGIPQAEYVFNMISSICSETFFSIREGQNQNDYFKKFPSIVDDSKYANSGPLGGIISAMKLYPDNLWLIIACDLPFLTINTVKHLVNNRDPLKKATAFISSSDHLPEPLCAIYEPGIMPTLVDCFENNIRCPRKILISEGKNIKLLELNNPQALDNVNTPEEYAHTVRSLQLPNSSTPGGKRVEIQYFAVLREQSGKSKEIIFTDAKTAEGLYNDLKKRHQFTLSKDILKVAVNNEFCPWSTEIEHDDIITFIPPVAGG